MDSRTAAMLTAPRGGIFLQYFFSLSKQSSFAGVTAASWDLGLGSYSWFVIFYFQKSIRFLLFIMHLLYQETRMMNRQKAISKNTEISSQFFSYFTVFAIPSE